MAASDSRNPRVGRVLVPGATPHVFERFADGTWRVTAGGRDQPEIAAAFQQIYADRYTSPADGQPGVAALHDLAASLGGTVEIDPVPEPPPGTVY